jgi:unsaturated chondroitin disaccharide hydrolase
MELSAENAQWIKSVYGKVIKKELSVATSAGKIIPYTTDATGRFVDKYAENPAWWTNGFWMGILWLLYKETSNQSLAELAAGLEEKMDAVLTDIEQTDHDVGFIWHLSSVANWRITGNLDSKRRGLVAAGYLSSRFNPSAGFLTAWNSPERQGWSIIDTMMNLPLLFWANRETGQRRYADIAACHADKTMENAIRSDGSVHHVVEYNLDSGCMIQAHLGQGYAVGSSWSRGQAWAVYGFTLAFLYTGKESYLATAKKAAHYFVSAAASFGNVPPVDFRGPAFKQHHDTTAGAIAVCGLIELSRAVEDANDGRMYLESAIRLLKALEAEHIDYGPASDALLHGGSEGWPPRRTDMDIIYGDYFILEAVCKLCGKDFNLWIERNS